MISYVHERYKIKKQSHIISSIFAFSLLIQVHLLL